MPLASGDVVATRLFGIEIDGVQIAQFRDVAGVSNTIAPIEYRENTPDGIQVLKKLPGNQTAGDITLRRGKSGDRALYTHGSNRLEMLWTIITAFVFIALGVMGQSVWASLRLHDAPPGSYSVEVVAQQFQWNFHYAGRDNKFGRTDPKFIDDSALNFVGLDSSDPGGADDSVTAALAIPVNRPVELRLRSKDVIHNFWVPQLRFKQDLVPGMEIKVHFTANKVGKYELACAELCGQLHFKMKSYMLVLPEEEIQALQVLPQEQFQARIVELLAKYPLPTY